MAVAQCGHNVEHTMSYLTVTMLLGHFSQVGHSSLPHDWSNYSSHAFVYSLQIYAKVAVLHPGLQSCDLILLMQTCNMCHMPDLVETNESLHPQQQY